MITWVLLGVVVGCLAFALPRARDVAAARTNPVFARVFAAAQVFTKDERWAEALDVLDRADRSRLDRAWSARIDNLIAYCLVNLQRAEEAIPVAHRALRNAERAYDRVASGHTLGVALVRAGRPNEALPLLEDAVAEAPQSPEIVAECWYSLGEALLAVDRSPDARAALNNAVEADPRGKWGKRAEALLARGGAYR